MTEQIEEAKKAIAEASAQSNLAIEKLTEQQDRMLQQIGEMGTGHAELYVQIEKNQAASASFQEQQNEVTGQLKSELQELKASQAEFQASLRQELSGLAGAGSGGAGNSDQIMASIQSVMEHVSS